MIRIHFYTTDQEEDCVSVCAVQCSDDYLMARTDGGELLLWSIQICQDRGGGGGGGDPYSSPVIDEVCVCV